MFSLAKGWGYQVFYNEKQINSYLSCLIPVPPVFGGPQRSTNLSACKYSALNWEICGWWSHNCSLRLVFEKYELSRSHPLLGRDHLRPLADQLLDDIELPSEQRVLLHVHLVDVHLEQVKVEACGRVEKCTCLLIFFTWHCVYQTRKAGANLHFPERKNLILFDWVLIWFIEYIERLWQEERANWFPLWRDRVRNRLLVSIVVTELLHMMRRKLD